MSLNCLGVIPARGGSKGVHRKNIRIVANQPLIAYSIQAAQQSRSIAKFVTSTEDEEIASVARSLGSDVCMRPIQLAADDTPMIPVLQHVLGVVEHESGRFDYVVLLQPTAPLRTAIDIDTAMTLFIGDSVDSVVSVYQVEDHHPTRMYSRDSDGRLIPYAEEPGTMLRQHLPEVLHRNGAVYACRRELLDGEGKLIGTRTMPYIMPKSRSINIDDETDLLLADLILGRQQNADGYANPQR